MNQTVFSVQSDTDMSFMMLFLFCSSDATTKSGKQGVMGREGHRGVVSRRGRERRRETKIA